MIPNEPGIFTSRVVSQGGHSDCEVYAHARMGRILFFLTFDTTKGKGLKACTRKGMVFEWQKCTGESLFCTELVL